MSIDGMNAPLPADIAAVLGVEVRVAVGVPDVGVRVVVPVGVIVGVGVMVRVSVIDGIGVKVAGILIGCAVRRVEVGVSVVVADSRGVGLEVGVG